jgi:hypothetical protein
LHKHTEDDAAVVLLLLLMRSKEWWGAIYRVLLIDSHFGYKTKKTPKEKNTGLE